MKTPSTTVLASLAALLFVSGAFSSPSLEERTVPGKRHVSMSWARKREPHDYVAADRRRWARVTAMRRRDLTDMEKRQVILENLDNESNLYLANVSLGTPPQAVALQIDTGSSDVWLNDAQSSFCKEGQCFTGSYNSDDSSTYNYLNSDFDISYQDNSAARGDYFTDTFIIGNASVKNLQMGLGRSTDINNGIMGIGYASQEASVSSSNPNPYPNLPVALYQQKFISKPAFSMWLNDLDSSVGSVLFGGIDTAKYQGGLVGLPIQQNAQVDVITDFAVVWTSLSVTGTDNQNTSITVGNNAVILDSGTSLTYVPRAALEAIASGLGALEEQGQYYLECSNSLDVGVTFGFGGSKGVKIFVPIKELSIPTGYIDNAGNPICTLGIQEVSSDSPLLFGDTFLRSAYVVYDLADNYIYMAPTVYDATSSNVRDITTASGVPDVTGVASTVVASQTASVPLGVSGTGKPTNTRGSAGSTGTHKNAAPLGSTPSEVQFLLPFALMVILCMIGGTALIV